MVKAERALAYLGGMALLSKRGEKIERRFAHSLDSGVPRRTTLRGLAHNNKRYLCVNIGLDLWLILRKGTGVGKPPLPKRPLLAFGRWRRGSLDGGGRPAAAPRTHWQENPVPAPYHAWYFTKFPPTGGNIPFSTDSRSASSHFWSRQRPPPPPPFALRHWFSLHSRDFHSVQRGESLGRNYAELKAIQ